MTDLKNKKIQEVLKKFFAPSPKGSESYRFVMLDFSKKDKQPNGIEDSAPLTVFKKDDRYVIGCDPYENE